MGDVGEMYEGWREMKARQKSARAAFNIEKLFNESEIAAREQSKNVWRVDTSAGAVMYYPATNCWQHRGKTYRGDAAMFISWFKKQTFARPQ